jgi:hypothetical protein
MGKRFDAARLFEPWRAPRHPKPYPTDESALDAVQAGKKGMEMFPIAMGDLAEPRSELARWLKLAVERDLVVVLERGHLFISRPEELWRIPAYLALWKTAFVDGRWSDVAENQLSYLLGYTAQQRKRWIESQRQHTPAWTCATAYALLNAKQRAIAESVGRRCFGPPESIEGMSLFSPAGEELRKNALAQVPRECTLARVGLARNAHTAIFGKPKRGVTERKVTRKLAPVLSAGLHSNVQFLTRTGWK